MHLTCMIRYKLMNISFKIKAEGLNKSRHEMYVAFFGSKTSEAIPKWNVFAVELNLNKRFLLVESC